MRLFHFVIVSIGTFILCQRGQAQERVWRVGIHAGTGYYQLYNKNDWNADPTLIYPVKSEPTNWTVGAITIYTWGKHLGLGSGLLIAKNRQEFQAARNPDSPNPPGTETYSIRNEFNYLKLPTNFQFSTNNQAMHQFVISGGMQTSFLLSYKERFLQKNPGFYSENETRNKISRDIDNPNNSDGKYSAFLYNRFLLGFSGMLNYRLKFNDGWLLDIGINAAYDLTNAENKQAKFIPTDTYFWTSGIKRYGYGDVSTRPKTHNRAIGFFISASIPVDIR